jgi:hypothetical protein
MNIKKLTRKMEALIVAIAAICVSSLSFVSCEDETKSGGGTIYDPSKPIEITSFTPDSGRIAEMVLLDGSNFGTDVSNIKVFFNSKEAVVLSSTGSRILALVPRLPGDTCILSVAVGDKKVTYPGFFRYKIEASVTTIAGNGTPLPVVLGPLDQCQFRPLYMGVDHEFNIFVTTDDYILKLNVAENEARVVATGPTLLRLQCNANADNVIMLGNEGAGNRDFFYSMDPKDGWVAKLRYIKKWIQNGYELPSGGPSLPHENYETHHHCLYCYADGYYYTRYSSGHIVKINPSTWEAEIIYKTNPGVAYGLAFHPIRKTEVWMAYESGYGDALSNSICVFDVTDPEGTFRKVSSMINGGHRDGPLAQAQFQGIRQINFDSEGSLYISDGGNHCIRRIDTDNMMVETIIGIPQKAGYLEGMKETALFSSVHGIATDADGVIYVSDFGNSRVRRIAIE